MLSYDTMFLILLGDILNSLSSFELNRFVYFTESEKCKQAMHCYALLFRQGPRTQNTLDQANAPVKYNSTTPPKDKEEEYTKNRERENKIMHQPSFHLSSETGTEVEAGHIYIDTPASTSSHLPQYRSPCDYLQLPSPPKSTEELAPCDLFP